MIGKLLCFIGRHKWRQTNNTRKTGFVVQHFWFAEHELEIEHKCTRCGCRAAWGGFVPDKIFRAFNPKMSFPMREDGMWPVDDDGKQLPLSANFGKTPSPFRYIKEGS